MEKKNQNSTIGIISVVGMSIMFIAIASLLLFVPAIMVIYICYAMCAAMIIMGIYMIVHYFMTDAFRDLNQFGFSFGVLFVVLGLCGMLKAASLASAFLVYIGISLLFSGVIMLQFSLDLKRMKDVLWVVMLVVSIAVTICSILVILQPFGNREFYEKYTSYVLLVAGILCLIMMSYVFIRIRLYEKAELKKQQEEINQSDIYTQAASAAQDASDLQEGEKRENGATEIVGSSDKNEKTDN